MSVREQDALAHGADKSLFYYGDWIKKPGVIIGRKTIDGEE